MQSTKIHLIESRAPNNVNLRPRVYMNRWLYLYWQTCVIHFLSAGTSITLGFYCEKGGEDLFRVWWRLGCEKRLAHPYASGQRLASCRRRHFAVIVFWPSNTPGWDTCIERKSRFSYSISDVRRNRWRITLNVQLDFLLRLHLAFIKRSFYVHITWHS